MKHLFAVATLLIPMTALAASPDCSGTNSWATQMAAVHLKNAGIVGFDASGATTVRVASEKIGKDLYRQVHHVTFKGGAKTIEVLTVNNASHEECSMTGVDVYVISQHLGP